MARKHRNRINGQEVAKVSFFSLLGIRSNPLQCEERTRQDSNLKPSDP
jgi:hypothetical protein